jgi:FMN phosphatase YigB (HAD superfamily)
MIRAVLFDVDGTLYRQRPLRALMAAELAVVPWTSRLPWHVPRLWRVLSAFRRVREELRDLGRPDGPLATLQYSQAARRAGVTEAEVRDVVGEWIYRRPLKYLPHVVRRDAGDVFRRLRERGLGVGAFSDYPVADKLRAMRLDGSATLQLDATDSAINAFKPHPAGLAYACQQWGLPPAEVLYVGDRVDVDVRAAAQAGLPCAIVGARQSAAADFVGIPRLGDILGLVADTDGRVR